jgi:sterol desaturase/sphingolipid hydroxylase (fatty acid hydroxylase superfamily)
MLKEICWQSGVLGTVLVLVSFPLYTVLVSLLRSNLPTDYNDDAIVFALLTSIVHTGAYACYNSIFGAMDYFQLLQEYKLARKPYMQPKASLVAKTLLEAAFSQLVVNPLAAWYLLYPAFKSFGMMSLDDPLPDHVHLFKTMCFANAFNGVFFYLAHRTVHSKALYAIIHKQHHEYSGTMGIAAEYANPVEQILANMLPTLGGVFLAGTHPWVVCVWLYMRLQQTYEAHSGYAFFGTWYETLGLGHGSSTMHHDYHHTVNTGNFDPEWMDWICGTQDGYVAAGYMDGYLAKKKDQMARMSAGAETAAEASPSKAKGSGDGDASKTQKGKTKGKSKKK